mgnify:CR=1 FL=1
MKILSIKSFSSDCCARMKHHFDTIIRIRQKIRKLCFYFLIDSEVLTLSAFKINNDKGNK